MIVGDIPRLPESASRVVKGRLLSQQSCRGLIYVFLATSVMEQHKYFPDYPVFSRFFSIFNWAGLFSGILCFFSGAFMLEKEVERTRSEFQEIAMAKLEEQESEEQESENELPLSGEESDTPRSDHASSSGSGESFFYLQAL